MENLLTTIYANFSNSLAGDTVTAERAIHVAMFLLILVGLCALSAWASYTYLSGTLILEVASIALSWGVILLVLYLGFRKLEWDWWTEQPQK